MPDSGARLLDANQRSSFNNINYLELSITHTHTQKKILTPLAANNREARRGKGFYLPIFERSLVFDQSGLFFFPSLFVYVEL